MWGREIGTWLAEGHGKIPLLYGKAINLYRNGVYAILSEGKYINEEEKQQKPAHQFISERHLRHIVGGQKY